VVGWFNELSELRAYEITHKVEHNKRYRVALPQRLQPSEIESWLRLQRLDPTGFEIDLLMRLDASYVSVLRKSGGKPPAVLAPMSDSAGIGALFKSLAPPKHKPAPVKRKR